MSPASTPGVGRPASAALPGKQAAVPGGRRMGCAESEPGWRRIGRTTSVFLVEVDHEMTYLHAGIAGNVRPAP